MFFRAIYFFNQSKKIKAQAEQLRKRFEQETGLYFSKTQKTSFCWCVYPFGLDTTFVEEKDSDACFVDIEYDLNWEQDPDVVTGDFFAQINNGSFCGITDENGKISEASVKTLIQEMLVFLNP